MVANSCSKLNCSRLLTEIVRRTSTTIERTCANKNKNHFNSRVKKGTPSIYGYRVLLSFSSQLKEQRKDLRKLNSQIPKGINEKSNAKNKKLSQARENACDQVAFDWLRGWREFSRPITERSKARPIRSRFLWNSIKNCCNSSRLT